MVMPEVVPQARLVLINGAPGSGKSTLARALAQTRPLTLCLDIDRVRALLGRWAEAPLQAGSAAREMAIAMARTQLQSGRAVVVPQFLAKPEFIDQLQSLATEHHVRFDEVLLTSSAQEAASRFAARSANPTDETHEHAAQLQALSAAEDVAELYRRLMAMAADRPQTVRVASRPGEVNETLADLQHAIDWD